MELILDVSYEPSSWFELAEPIAAILGLWISNTFVGCTFPFWWSMSFRFLNAFICDTKNMGHVEHVPEEILISNCKLYGGVGYVRVCTCTIRAPFRFEYYLVRPHEIIWRLVSVDDVGCVTTYIPARFTNQVVNCLCWYSCALLNTEAPEIILVRLVDF